MPRRHGTIASRNFSLRTRRSETAFQRAERGALPPTYSDAPAQSRCGRGRSSPLPLAANPETRGSLDAANGLGSKPRQANVTATDVTQSRAAINVAGARRQSLLSPLPIKRSRIGAERNAIEKPAVATTGHRAQPEPTR